MSPRATPGRLARLVRKRLIDKDEAMDTTALEEKDLERRLAPPPPPEKQ